MSYEYVGPALHTFTTQFFQERRLIEGGGGDGEEAAEGGDDGAEGGGVQAAPEGGGGEGAESAEGGEDRKTERRWRRARGAKAAGGGGGEHGEEAAEGGDDGAPSSAVQQHITGTSASHTITRYQRYHRGFSPIFWHAQGACTRGRQLCKCPPAPPRPAQSSSTSYSCTSVRCDLVKWGLRRWRGNSAAAIEHIMRVRSTDHQAAPTPVDPFSQQAGGGIW